MAKSKKKKPLTPRVKRMTRQARLHSAKTWIPTYKGNRLLRGYCKHYGVDWRCAVIELTALGIKIDPSYVTARRRSEAELIRKRQTPRKNRAVSENGGCHGFTDAYSAYLAGDFPALHDLEMREQYGDNWEQRVSELCPIDENLGYENDALEAVDDQAMFGPMDGDDEIPF